MLAKVALFVLLHALVSGEQLHSPGQILQTGKEGRRYIMAGESGRFSGQKLESETNTGARTAG